METLYKIIFFSVIYLIVINIFYYKAIRLYFYTKSCFKNIIEDERLQNLYQIKIDNKSQQNIRMSIFNIMYIYVIIPENVTSDLHLQYLQDHLRFLEEALSVQNLYGLVKTEKKKYIIPSDNEKGNKSYIYLIKFIPILQGTGFKKFVLFATTVIAVFIALQKFNVYEIVYNFLF